MFTFQTKTNKTNRGVTVTARCKGKQRTIPWDDRHGIHYNHMAAVGTLANLVMTKEQQAKVIHPSGRQRVTQVVLNDGTGTVTMNV